MVPPRWSGIRHRAIGRLICRAGAGPKGFPPQPADKPTFGKRAIPSRASQVPDIRDPSRSFARSRSGRTTPTTPDPHIATRSSSSAPAIAAW